MRIDVNGMIFWYESNFQKVNAFRNMKKLLPEQEFPLNPALQIHVPVVESQAP